MQRVIYAGTFDPITHGHLDIIERAGALFDTVIVAVGNNPAKKALFSTRERAAMVRSETRHLANVEVRSFSGLLVDFAGSVNVSVVIRGIRTVSDFEYELQMALTNRAAAGLETLFMTPRPDYQFLNAQLIREIASMGGDTSAFLPPAVEKRLRAKFKKQSAARTRKLREPRR